MHVLRRSLRMVVVEVLLIVAFVVVALVVGIAMDNGRESSCRL